ncbi:MAG: efflux RND transporter periplasmic adaptor subunit [Phycisphaerales bacterium]|nr:efflux RND transporter periplasmic adaptor subunit [Phycisphaerales bacterium]
MKRFIDRLRPVATTIWKHTAALVAVLLILAALVIGYRIGRPAPEPTDASTAAPPASDDGAPQMYTCSMHPSVRLPDPDAKCPICFMDLIPVQDDTDSGGERRLTMSEAAAAMSRIETTPVGRFFPTAEVRMYGRVTYDETSVARLTSYFPGRIDRLFVNFVGVPVSRGDHIAEVYSPEILAAFEELRQAVAAAADAEQMSDLVRSATLDTLGAAREKLRLFGLSPDQIAGVERGEHQGDRLTVFAPIGGVVTHLGVREGDYVQTGQPIATVADLTRLWLDLEAYESQLPMLRWGQPVTFTVEAHPGEVFEGRISFIEPIVDAQTRTAAVRVAVDNADRRLKPGMFASAVVRARMGDDGAVLGDELAGRWVSPMHPTIVKDGPGQCDICGMDLVPAETLGIARSSNDAREPLVVPRSAVLFTGRRSVVYVAVPDADRPTYEGREVMLGSRAGEFYIVRDGLAEGERVVVNGAFRIDSAMQIAAKPSMMMPAGPDHANAAASGSGHEPMGSPRAPDAFVLALSPVYAAYLDGQEALAADDLAGFARAGDRLSDALQGVPVAGIVGEPLATWRRAAAQLRVESEFADIEAARVRFEAMSRGVIALQRTFGHRGSQTWSLAFCPMAFDNTGAEWIQRADRIDNPYFGATMRRCGEIREAFPPSAGAPQPPSGTGHEGHTHE